MTIRAPFKILFLIFGRSLIRSIGGLTCFATLRWNSLNGCVWSTQPRKSERGRKTFKGSKIVNTTVATTSAPSRQLDRFERYLSVWVLVCMAIGMLFGKAAPELVGQVSHWEFVRGSQVNAPIALLIWLMIYPMMLKIDFSGLKVIALRPKGLLITLFVNWLVKPFSMAFLGWLFIQALFGRTLGWIDPNTAKNYTVGLIILAAAPCTAMVFVWSYLTDGDGPYTLAQVAINDLIMIFAF